MFSLHLLWDRSLHHLSRPVSGVRLWWRTPSVLAIGKRASSCAVQAAIGCSGDVSQITLCPACPADTGQNLRREFRGHNTKLLGPKPWACWQVLHCHRQGKRVLSLGPINPQHPNPRRVCKLRILRPPDPRPLASPSLQELFAGGSSRVGRDRLVHEAVRVHHHKLQQVADHLGLHFTTVSVIAKREASRIQEKALTFCVGWQRTPLPAKEARFHSITYRSPEDRSPANLTSSCGLWPRAIGFAFARRSGNTLQQVNRKG
jgi:hypothetical protein